MIGPKFEVGKEYVCVSGLRAICRYGYESNGYNCMFGEVTVGVGGDSVGQHTKCSGSGWKEYHEPVVVKDVRHVIQCFSGKVWTKPNKESVSSFDKVVGKVEFTITDGKLTDVRIVA